MVIKSTTKKAGKERQYDLGWIRDLGMGMVGVIALTAIAISNNTDSKQKATTTQPSAIELRK